MREVNVILAHHAGARLYRHRAGRYPSAEELARLVSGEAGLILEELAAYRARGCLEVAQAVLESPGGLAQDLGQLYQKLRRIQEKKSLGQVFTPDHAVEAALALLGSGQPQRIIDPACGAGEFLLRAARYWPQAQILGVDIDPLALAVAKTRLSLAGTPGVELVRGNALVLPLGGEFDLVLGNPPWGGQLDPDHVPTSAISPGKVLNSFVYFLELAARLLKPGGRMALVLPEAFLKVWSYKDARQWFLANFHLIGLHYLPHLFKGYYAPAIILAAVRQPAPSPAGIPIWCQRGRRGEKFLYNALPGPAVQAQRININWRREMEILWSKCAKNAVYLREGQLGAPLPPGEAVVDFSMGIVTGDNRRFIRDKPLSGCLPLLTARDVMPFRVEPASRWLSYYPAKLQQVAPPEKYMVPAKIVYRFISREIIAAADYSGSLTLNNLNIIIPLRLPFPLEYLLALLNSRLINTLYMYKFFTGKVLTRHLKQLPLQVGSGEEREKIIAQVRALAAGQGDARLLNAMVYDLYGLGEAERDLVCHQYRRLSDVFFV
ncbi:MAG: TaqI-like C-terminal specificity domain-containing protein [Bacillota bacterium]|jgi:SAM-dependent methyltransferase